MATITRIEAIEQIQKVLKAYACKIYELRHGAECLPPAGKAIIDSYCCNENEEQNLIRQACLRVSFFKNINNNQLLDFYVVCYGLNEYLGLGVKDLIQVTDVTEDKESFWETFWGALQGEFNEDPSGASILIDMSLNFIPGVGQVLDARDIIACLDKLVLQRRYEEVTVWATLILTAIGCIPYAGDVIKAIGKSIIKEADDIVLMLLKKLDAEDVYSAFIKFYEILQESIEDAIKLIDKWLREAAGRYKESELGELIRNANGYIKKALGVIQTKIDEFGERVFGKGIRKVEVELGKDAVDESINVITNKPYTRTPDPSEFAKNASDIIENYHKFTWDENTGIWFSPDKKRKIWYEDGWKYEGENKIIIEEFTVLKSFKMKTNYKTSTIVNKSFMQAHHGIQSAWAKKKLAGYYNENDAPVLLLRDSCKGTPHEFINNMQKRRNRDISYFQARFNLENDLIKLQVNEVLRNEYLKYVDEYFYSIYKQMKEDDVDNIDLIFDFDFQTHTKLFKEK